MTAGRKASPVFAALEAAGGRMVTDRLPTPCYLIDEEKLEDNCRILAEVMEHTGCRILLAQKAFSNYDCYPLLARYLTGTEASGLYEARLGAEEMPGREVHVYCGAYREEEFEEILRYADHIVFNSPAQLKKFGKRARACKKSIGLRINPECSTQEGHAIYDPCAPGSRLGVTREVWERQMTEEWIEMLDGIHFHTLCEQNADALAVTMKAVEEKFADVLPRMQWLNMGGGHHVTRPDYDRAELERILTGARDRWDLQIYLEPGEAVAFNAGYLVSTVLDVLENHGVRNVILDASAACHMPDVIEMPYLPPVYGTCRPGEEGCNCRLGGPTCLAGDVIGEYRFPKELKAGDRVIFGDMAIYTTCKNNTFNGMPLPDIWIRQKDGTLRQAAHFGYEDFKGRLGRREDHF